MVTARLDIPPTGAGGSGSATTTDDHGYEDLDKEDLRQSQSQDLVLTRVKAWVEASQRPEWPEVSALDTETKALYLQWDSITSCNGLLYCAWRFPGNDRTIFQLLVPRCLHPKVLQLVHGSVGAGHFGVGKAHCFLRSWLYWPWCRQDVEIYREREGE